MIHEDEIIMLALGIGIYFFAIVNKAHLERVPGWNLLLFAYHVLLAGWALTVFEGLLFPGLFNVLEHLCYACSTMAMAVWCWKVTRAGEREEK